MSNDNLDLIRHAATSPRELAERLGLKVDRSASRGNRVRVLCPAHNEKNAACSIGERDGQIVWNCFACHAGGDIFALIAAVHGLNARTDFPQIVQLAADAVGVTLPARGAPYVPAPPDPNRRLKRLAIAMNDAVDDWFKGAEFDEGTLDGRLPFKPHEWFGQPSDALLFDASDVLRDHERVRREEHWIDRRLEEIGDVLERADRINPPAYFRDAPIAERFPRWPR